jgi:hypothetical protein
MATSLLSTFLINWGVNPYVGKIYLHSATSSDKIPSAAEEETKSVSPESGRVTFETYTIFGKPFHTQVPLSALSPTNARPFANWTISQTPREEFYLRKPFLYKKRKWFFVQQENIENSEHFKQVYGKVQSQTPFPY